MSRGYLGGRRQARKHHHWNSHKSTRRHVHHGGQSRSGTLSTAEGMGCLMLAVLVITALAGGLPLLFELLIDTVRYPLLGLTLAGAGVLLYWTWRRGRRAAPKRADVRSAARVETVAERNERIMAQAWMETVAQDGKDARVQSMAQAWLDEERDRRYRRAERTQAAWFREYQEWCVAARKAGLTDEDLGLEEWESGLA